MGAADAHLVEVPGGAWQVWRAALFRTTGFPADGLAAFACPEAAAVVDAHLDGAADQHKAEQAFAEAAAQGSRALSKIAADPLFREALVWQNPRALHVADSVAAETEPARLNRRRRRDEDLLARYWQRYCAKTETIGFFGPVSWSEITSRPDVVTAEIGPRLVRARATHLEYWVLDAYARHLAQDRETRSWLPVRLPPHLALDGTRLLHPTEPARTLTPQQAQLLAHCDGRPAREVLAALDGTLAERADLERMLADLHDRSLVSWGIDLPLNYTAQSSLYQGIQAIGDERTRQEALAGLDRLDRARARVAEAAGDAGALLTALAELDDDVTAVTGSAPRQRPGEMYAGRTPCYEDTIRDLDLSFGAGLLDGFGPALTRMAHLARWLTAELAAAVRSGLTRLHADLAEDSGGHEVPFGQLWYLARGVLFGPDHGPVAAVLAEFSRQWAALFALDTLPEDVREVHCDSARLDVETLFPADRPGWAGARLHSPDLQLCAENLAALRRGDFFAVLGELHVSWPTFDSGVTVRVHPDPEQLRADLRTDIGSGRMLPLFPPTWPRVTARVARCLENADDRQLGFVAAPGADPERLVRIAGLTVTEHDGELLVHGPGGFRRPVLDLFSELLMMRAVDAFRSATARPHTPRITVDRLVVCRESWRTTVGETGLSGVAGHREQYLAARRWRRELGLPERVFAKFATEGKPLYVDFTSPVYAAGFCSALRAAARAGKDTTLTITELLPGPEHAWLPDAEGRTYLSELRVQLRDPGAGE
ncbi:lantibiotic dehydratase [Amycolatopsis benzoatilytica]|uniref:lantibiotic dehydratase n=1 Tax=Amycolatopsis benzoatilytica TaxID=346045 RepID=UPI000372D7B2|nr:lantibiotic dehydratase [Amycolatopsis benzoatilytica]